MARKILSGFLIGLSAIFLLLSLAGVIAAWAYNTPLTEQATTRLTDIDTQLADSQASLKLAEGELQRALRMVDAAQAALDKLSKQTASAADILGSVKGTLDNTLLPGLQSTRAKVESARQALQELQTALDQLNTIPFLNVKVPDGLLQNLIDSADSLDAQIASVQETAQQASTFVGDTSYLLGGDLTETRDNLQTMLTTLQDYDTKITGWRAEIAGLIQAVPGWLDRASIILTVFLLWFAFSQFGLLLHGLNLWQGGDPLIPLRK